MAYLPAVDDRLLSMLESCDLVLFDGTFWTDDDLVRVQGGGRSARQMGHSPISGQAASSVNNTNPILDKDSPQYREVRETGWDVAEDGWEFTLRQTKPLAF